MNTALALRAAPISGATPAQSRARQTLGGLNQAYQALPMIKKGSWQHAANLLNSTQHRAGKSRLSASNTYVALNSALLSVGKTPLDNAPAALLAPPILPSITLAAALNGTGVNPFTLALAAQSAYPAALQISAAPPAPAGKPTFPDHSFKAIGSLPSLPATPADISALYINTYGIPEPGAQIALKITPVSDCGLRLPPLLLAAVACAPPQAAPPLGTTLAIDVSEAAAPDTASARQTTGDMPMQVKRSAAPLVGLAALAALSLAARPAAAQQTLYVSNSDNIIEKFTPGGIASVFASDPGSNGVLGDPEGLAFDSAGNLYAANYSDTIEKFTPGGVASTFASDPGSNSVLNGPMGLAFDSAGNLYAATSVSNTIEKFTPGGVASTFASDPGDGSVLKDPLGLAFDSAGNLYAANANSDTIEKFTPGGVATVFASDPGDGSVLNGPGGLAFDSAGNLYAATSVSNTIEKFTPGGVATVFASDPGDGSVLNGPVGLAFDSAGNLYAANANSDTIEEFSPLGVPSLFASNPGDLSVLYGPTFLAFRPAPAPEPSQYAALGLGILGLCALGLRARKRRPA